MSLLARLVTVLLTGAIAWLVMVQPSAASPLRSSGSAVYGHASQMDTTP